MADSLCRPRGLSGIEKQHHGKTGLIVSGRFKPLVYWVSADGWARVAVRIDGKREDAVVMWEAKPGPYWIDLTPGRHTIEFIGNGTHDLRREAIDLKAGHAEIICFKAARWRPFMSPTEPRWCSARAW